MSRDGGVEKRGSTRKEMIIMTHRWINCREISCWRSIRSIGLKLLGWSPRFRILNRKILRLDRKTIRLKIRIKGLERSMRLIRKKYTRLLEKYKKMQMWFENYKKRSSSTKLLSVRRNSSKRSTINLWKFCRSSRQPIKKIMKTKSLKLQTKNKNNERIMKINLKLLRQMQKELNKL